VTYALCVAQPQMWRKLQVLAAVVVAMHATLRTGAINTEHQHQGCIANIIFISHAPRTTHHAPRTTLQIHPTNTKTLHDHKFSLNMLLDEDPAAVSLVPAHNAMRN
jgi:hypothetical protein